MKTTLKFTMLSLTVAALGCGAPDRIEVQKAATARTTPTAADLQAAPSTYTRMRFVSPIEQGRTRAGEHIAHAAVARRTTPPRTDAIASLATRDLRLAHTQLAAAAEPAVSVSMAPEPARMAMPMAAMPAGDSEMLDHAGEPEGHGPSVHVVIRGGNPGDKKCDPRTDTHTTPREIGRPDFAMPQPTGRSVFGGRQR